MARARPLTLTVAGEAMPKGGWISAPASAPVPIHFSEGTDVTLDPSAHLRVAEVTRRGAHLLLESGTAHVSVTPGRGGQWTFTAGPFQVDVKGTRFDLAWSPQEQVFSLKLVEGSVFVSGCSLGDGHPLSAGETLNASCLSHEFHIDRASSGASAALAPPPAQTASGAALAAPAPVLAAPAPVLAAPADANLDPSELATRPAGSTPRAPSGRPSRAGTGEDTWQSLARASRFKDAFARVNERGF